MANYSPDLWQWLQLYVVLLFRQCQVQETTTAIPMNSWSIASCRCFADGSCSCDRSPGHDGHALVLEMERETGIVAHTYTWKLGLHINQSSWELIPGSLNLTASLCLLLLNAYLVYVFSPLYTFTGRHTLLFVIYFLFLDSTAFFVQFCVSTVVKKSLRIVWIY